MSISSTTPVDGAPPGMAPVRPKRRIEIVDVLRGFSILGILIFNMLGYSGFLYTPLDALGYFGRITVLLIRFFVQAKFYTLFSFLFGWGMAIQLERANRRSAGFAGLYLRRLLILLAIGLTHATLLWDGDILVSYAVLGVFLLPFRRCSPKTILILAGVCLLIPVLLYSPGPAATFREWYAELTDPWRQTMIQGYGSNVFERGSYLEVTLHRLRTIRSGYTGVVYWGPHIFAMFLLGLYVGRRKILHDVSQHTSLFRWVLWVGLGVGLVCNGLFVAVTHNPSLVPEAYETWATSGARTIGGPAFCLVYVSAIVLLTRREAWRQRFRPLAAVGRMALTNYLSHSLLLPLVFYGYGLGLYGQIGPPITLVLTFFIYAGQIWLSNRWLSRYRFGPAEWLWRSLTYGKLQPMRREEEAKEVGPIPSAADALGDQVVFNWILFVGRRLLYIVVVAFAIVYFCTVGLQLSVNSTTMGRRLTVGQVARPAFNDTVRFFERACQGDLGTVIQGVYDRQRVEIAGLLAEAYVQSARLLIAAVGFAALLGIVAGGVAASYRHSPLSVSTLTLTVIGVSIPSFFLALLLRVADIAFYQRTGVGLVPVFGSSMDRTQSLLPHVTFPALVLAARPLAHITRVSFVSISEVLQRDFIRTAQAKGLRSSVVFWRHGLRNAGVSILTAVAVSLRFALGSLPVVEVFFDWHGLGSALLEAIQRGQTTMVAALGLSLGVTFMVINLLIDVVYRFIDPRLRERSNGGAA